MNKLERKVDLLIDLVLSNDEAMRTKVVEELTRLKPVNDFTAADGTPSMVNYTHALLCEIGIPASLKGHKYLVDAVSLVVEDPDLIYALVKEVYAQVAKLNNTTPSRVERAIRHAIEIAWDRGDIDVLSTYFGYTVSSSRGRPTNKEFIGQVAIPIRRFLGLQ